jgi:ferritin-like metal-binding protein YciE
MRDNKDILQQYVSDMLALDHHILEAIDRQLADERLDNYSGARQVVQSIKSTLTSQASGLEQQLKSLGGEASGPVKDAISTVAGVAAGLYDKVRHDPVSKMLRDDYTALSLASISYTMMHTTGLALKHDGVASAGERYLKELAPIVVEISKVIPTIVVQDLAEEEVSIEAGVGQQAVRNTQKAWDSSNTK